MLYAILCYDDEKVVSAWTKEQDDAAMVKLGAVQERLAREGKLGPVAERPRLSELSFATHGNVPGVPGVPHWTTHATDSAW